MDHIWSDLDRWLRIWEDRIADERKRPNPDIQYINHLKKDIEAIEKAMKEIHKRF